MADRFIKKLSGFVQFSEEDIAALQQATPRPRSFEANEDLISEGDQPGPVLVVLDGWAFRYKVLPGGTRQIMAFLMPGDSCDLHVGLLAKMDHSIATVTRASVTTLSRSTMDDLMASRPAIAQAMYISQLVDEATLRAWIVGLGRRNSLQRAAHLLLELFIRASNIGSMADDTISLPLTQPVLADALGLTPIHVNRVLQSLRRSGVLDLSRGLLCIRDSAALARVSGFDDGYLHKRMRGGTAYS